MTTHLRPILACAAAALLAAAIFLGASDHDRDGRGADVGERRGQELTARLVVRDVDLGVVATNQNLECSVPLQNRSGSPVHLLTPQAGRGCVPAKKGPQTVGPGEVFQSPFVIKTGEAPQELRRAIVFHDRDHPGITWTAIIYAEVIAPIWASPRSLAVHYSPSRRHETLTENVTLQSEDGVSVTSVTSDSRCVKPTLLGATRGSTGLTLRVAIDTSAEAHGAASLECATNLPGVSLAIPVRWEEKPPVRWIPATLATSPAAPPRGALTRTVVVHFGEGSAVGGWNVEPVVTWAEVKSWRSYQFAGVLELELKPALMPRHFRGVVLKLIANDRSQSIPYRGSY